MAVNCSFFSNLYFLPRPLFIGSFKLQELLLAGANPNAVDNEGESVLHRAVAKKYTECAIVILENGGCKSMGVLNSKTLTYVDNLFFFSPSVFS